MTLSTGLVYDVRRCGRELPPWYLTIIREGTSEVYEHFRPYFFLIVHKSIRETIIRQELTPKFEAVLPEIRRRYGKVLSKEELDEIAEEPYVLEETDMKAWVFVPFGGATGAGRYVKDPNFRVYRVKTWIPWTVRKVGSELVGGARIRAAAMNILYVARFVADNYAYRPLGITPIYIDPIDMDIFEKLKKVRYKVFDIEVLKDGTKVMSVMEVNLLDDSIKIEEIDRIKKDLIRTYIWKRPGEEDAEQAAKELRDCTVLAGFNIEHYDLRQLKKDGLIDESYVHHKCVIDLFKVIRTQAQASGIGTASFALQDILFALKDRLGIPADKIGQMIITKMLGVKMLRELNSAIEYNINDVIVTWRVAELYLPYVFGVAGLVQIAPSAVLQLRPGQIFEYLLVFWFQRLGQIIEARPVFTNEAQRLLLKGEKVFTFREVLSFVQAYGERVEKLIEQYSDLNQLLKELWRIADEILKKIIKRQALEESKKRKKKDINALFTGKIIHLDVELMYPTKIEHEYICPACYIGGMAEDARFAANRMESPFYALVSRIYEARWTMKVNKKKVEKELERLKAEGRLDKDTEIRLKTLKSIYSLLSDLLKPIINSAYGAMSKSSGPTHGGHLQVALKIFHDTIRDIVTLMLYTYSLRKILKKELGIEVDILPIYGDTDSLFVRVSGSVDDKTIDLITKKIVEAAEKLGYRLALEDIYDYMYIFRKKSYVVGKYGQFCKLKGQFVGKLKHLTSAYVRGLILESLAKNSVQDLVKKVLETKDALLLLPSLSKTFVDLVLKSTEDLKRLPEEKKENYLKVKIAKTNIFGSLKCLRPASFDLARLAALALVYGKKKLEVTCPRCGRKLLLKVSSTATKVKCSKCGAKFDITEASRDAYYLIDFTSLEDVNDLADLRALLILSGDRLSGDVAIVGVEKGGEIKLYKVTVDSKDCYYILADPSVGEEEQRVFEIPTDYSRWPGKLKLLKEQKEKKKIYVLLGLKLRVRILGEVTIDELQYAVLHDIYRYMLKTQLGKLVKDLHVLAEALGVKKTADITTFV